METCENVTADTSVKKIILERKNELALASSRVLARASGTWHMQAGQTHCAVDTPRLAVPFDKAFFERVMRDEARVFDAYRSLSRNVSIMNRKLHSSDTVSRFEPHNHADMLQALQAAGHPEWVTEQPV